MGNAFQDANLAPALRMVSRLYNLDVDQAETLASRYAHALHAIATDNDWSHVEEPEIDGLWHLHIIDMARYRRFCEIRFGRVIEHALPETPLEDVMAEEKDRLANVAVIDSGAYALACASRQCSGPGKEKIH